MDANKVVKILKESIAAVASAFPEQLSEATELWPPEWKKGLGKNSPQMAFNANPGFEKQYDSFMDFVEKFDRAAGFEDSSIESFGWDIEEEKIWIDARIKIEEKGWIKVSFTSTSGGDTVELDKKEYSDPVKAGKAFQKMMEECDGEDEEEDDDVEESGPDAPIGRPDQPADSAIRDEFINFLDGLVTSIEIQGLETEAAMDAVFSAADDMALAGDLPDMPDADDSPPEDLTLWLMAARGVDIVGRAVQMSMEESIQE